MGVVAKARFPVAMAAAEAAVEAVCCSGRLGGSLRRQEAAGSPRRPGASQPGARDAGERPGERVAGPLSPGGPGGPVLSDPGRPEAFRLGNSGSRSVSGPWGALPLVAVCVLRPFPPFSSRRSAMSVESVTFTTLFGVGWARVPGSGGVSARGGADGGRCGR